jgi:2-oxoglutarate ferredoxin oxidoreductase subunit gamma
LFTGKVLATAAMGEGKEVSVFPSYGAEVRGGAAHCTVIVSERMIGSPVAVNPDALIAMNETSASRFLQKVKPRGLFLFDSSLIKAPAIREDLHTLPVPASALAAELRLAKSANMILLGAFIAKTSLLGIESVTAAIAGFSVRGTDSANNRKAIETGWNYVEDTKSKDTRP